MDIGSLQPEGFGTLCVVSKMSIGAVHQSHHCLHHISLVVSEGFDSVENIDDVLLLDHLTDAADGTESSRTPSAGPVTRGKDGRWTERRREEEEEKKKIFFHQIKADCCDLGSFHFEFLLSNGAGFECRQHRHDARSSDQC